MTDLKGKMKYLGRGRERRKKGEEIKRGQKEKNF